MNFRKFGNTDLVVSEIGFGAWAIGGGAMIGTTPIGWGDANDKTSKEAIYKSLEVGINFFDTADIYGLGHSEELLGNTIGNRKDVVIASKAGNVSRNAVFTTDYRKEHILQACEASLKRLKREVIDYYQLHSARLADLQKGECIEAIQQLIQEGKIRYWGLSLPTFEPGPEAAYLMSLPVGSGFQLVLNIINRAAIPLVKDACAAGYGIIVRMPLQFGLLSGKFDAKTSFPDNDHRKRRLPKEIIGEFMSRQSALLLLSRKYGITQAQLAISYLLSYPEVSTVIPGIRTSEQAFLNSGGIKILSHEDRKQIESIDFSPLMEMIREKG
ncbi:MAG: aldo/keto reductase [Ginsengibacter sp.]